MPLLLLFFFSGATSLTYQVLWVRELQLVFGTSTFAVSTVLAAFMGGLSLGGFAIGRSADRLRRPLSAYGVLEIGIGVYALVFPWLVGTMAPLYLEAWRTLEPGPVLFGVIQFVLVGSALLVPTAAMGATLPLLARFRIRHLESIGTRIGTLYSVNTFGAVAGTWLCGFILLPHVGRWNTTLTAAATNVTLGLAALWLSRDVSTGAQTRAIRRKTTAAIADSTLLIPVSVALALAGFSVLVYEVAWTRLLSLILGGSSYAFSLMLVVFLAGIALGGTLGGRLADRELKTGGRTRLLLVFGAIEVAAAVLAFASMYLYPELPYWYVWLFDFLNASQHPEAAWWVSLVMAGLVMAPAAVLMGMHFPIAVRALVTDAGQLGAGVGVLYGANTLGGVFGAFVAGFVLLPVVWMQGTILVAALAGLMAAALLMIRAAEGSRRAWLPVGSVGLVALTLGLAFVAQRPPWNPLLMTAGLYHYVTTFDDHSRAGIRQYSTGLYDLRFYEEGLTSVVTVAQNKGSAHLWLAVNGKVDASTTSDMPTQVLLAALPMQFVEAPADVLIVGLASGVSAGAAARSSHVKRLDIAEIEPAVERGAAYFSAWNHNVLADPRVEVIHNDARNHLLLTEPGRYDIVISEPSNPWISGVANLFTREFFELGKTRLKPGGVWSQWIQTYGMDSVDLRSLLRTFADVYPHVLVYTTTDQSDLVVVGSESVLDMTQERTRRAIDVHGLAPDLVRVGISSNIEMVSLFVMDRPAIMAMTEGVTPNTDDNMRIEYSTPLKLHREMRGENLQMLMAHAGLPDAALGSSADLWQTLAEVYQRRRDIRYQAAINRAAALETRSGQTMMPLPD